MPNWCMNVITIKFIRHNDEAPYYGNALLKAFKKYEERFEEDSEEDSFEEGLMQWTNPLDTEDGKWDYSTAVYQWGCKWDFKPTHYEVNSEYAYIECDTPWSPPISWIDWLIDHEDVRAVENNYHEPSMDFVGIHNEAGFHETDSSTFIKANFDQRRLEPTERLMLEFWDFDYRNWVDLHEYEDREQAERDATEHKYSVWDIGDPVSSKKFEKEWRAPRGFFVAGKDEDSSSLIVKNEYEKWHGKTWVVPVDEAVSPLYGVHFADLVERNKEVEGLV